MNLCHGYTLISEGLEYLKRSSCLARIADLVKSKYSSNTTEPQRTFIEHLWWGKTLGIQWGKVCQYPPYASSCAPWVWTVSCSKPQTHFQTNENLRYFRKLNSSIISFLSLKGKIGTSMRLGCLQEDRSQLWKWWAVFCLAVFLI